MKRQHKLLSLLMALAMTLSLAAPALAEGMLIAPGPQIPWYAEAQAYVTEKGLMTGTDTGFAPEATVNKATVYQILFNMEGKPAAQAGTLADIEGKWYQPAAQWAQEAGLTAGDVFGGDETATRTDIVTLLYGYMNYKKADVSVGEQTNILSYLDVAEVAEDAIPAFQWACGAGVVQGDELGNLKPNASLTRAELAALLMRLPSAEYNEYAVAIEVPEQGGIPAHTIPGILTVPTGEGKYPAVVMLHGTGSDKHEAGGGYDIAAPLMARAGIATLRIDFMGSGESQADYVNYSYTSASLDAKAAADYLAGLETVDGDKLAVMGWSQGGTNALLAAAAHTDTFKAVVTWSGAPKLDGVGLFGEKTFEEAYAQAKRDGSYTMEFDWREALSVGERWFEDVKSTDVLTETAKIAAPVLAINGDQDVVVDKANAAAIAEAAQNGRDFIVEGADHTYNVFTEAETGYAALTATVNVGIGFLQETLNGAVTGTVNAVSKYGNVGTDVPLDVFAGAGYEVGDILTITVGGATTVDAPYGTGYSNVDTGNVVIVPDSSTSTVAAAINMGNFSDTYYAVAGTPIAFSMKEKEGYLEEYEIRNIDSLRTNDRADYASDEVFANFRGVVMGDIAEGVLYRASSPVNPELGRNTYADALIKEAGVKTIIDLADSQEERAGYEGFADSYAATTNTVCLNMGVDFAAEDFAGKLKTGLEFMIANEGPYLIHCNEGKDRAGFVAMLLEALMGGKQEEIVDDYMLSFENYYGVEKDSDRWNRIAQSNVIANLLKLTGAADEAALDKADLAAAAETYLTGTVGLTAEQIHALRDALSK